MSNLTPLVSVVERAGVRALRSLYPLLGGDAPTIEIHVAGEGTWSGHASGEFTLDRAAFEQIVRNFEASSNPIVLDYEHSTVYAAEAPAAGWIHRIYIKDTDAGAQLWCTAELTEKAAKYVKNGEYKFSSGVFEFGATDHVTGEDIGVAMSSCALTNSPFILGQVPLQLSRRAASAAPSTNRRTLMKITKEALAKALDLIEGDELSEEELMAAAHMAAAQDGSLAEEPEAEEPGEEAPMAAPEEDPAAMADGEEEDEMPASDTPAGDLVEAADTPDDPAALAEDMPGEGDAAAAAVAPLLEATGLDMAGLAAAIMENLDAVASALAGALEAPAAEAPLSSREAELALSARDHTIAALSAKVSDLEAFKSTREREDAERDVDTLIEGGLLLGDAREDWVSLRLSNRASFDKMTATLKAVVPLGAHAVGVTPPAQNADESIAIPEGDPEVVALRRQLKAARFPEARINEVLRRRIAARN